MYKKLFFIIALPLLTTACHKNSAGDCNTTGVPNATEIATLQTYLNKNSITAIQDPGGFFYQVIAAGSGATPVITSNVSVHYTGKLLDGTVFESRASGPVVTFPLSGVIRGWQLGIPLIKKGGSINLYLPPSLAYGCNGQGPIPGNSSLIFNIDLVDVQ